MISFNNHFILITGCNGNIGQKLCEAFFSQKAHEIIIDKAQNLFDDLKSLLDDYIQSDLTSIDERKSLINLLRKYPKIDVLINNAAYTGESNLSGWTSQFEHQSIQAWNLALEVNLTAPFHLIQGLLPSLMAAPHPKIINVGSIYGSRGPHWDLYEDTSMGNPCAYAASKGGLIQMTKWLSTTLSPKINVNTISPGIFRNQPKSFVEKYVKNTF